MSLSETETRRQDALARYEVVDTPAEEGFNRFVHIAAQALGMPIALVSFIASDRQWAKARHGIDLEWSLREHAFCDHTIRSDSVFIINDARQDERFRDNPQVVGPPHVRFYAGAPIITADGYRIGAMCVLSTEPCTGFDAGKQRLLSDLAQSVMTELELRRAHREQSKIVADLAFWNRVSDAIASSPDFDTALDHTLSSCAERTGAALCFLTAYHPTQGMIEYVKGHLDPFGGLRGLDVSKWSGAYPVGYLSFGASLAGGLVSDSGPLRETDPVHDFPLLHDLVRAGIRRQLVYPFDLAERRFGLVLDFETPVIDDAMGCLVREFIGRLIPLLMGRLREDALENANRTLRMIHASSDAFAQADTPDALFTLACKLAVDVGLYDTCWIGLAQDDAARSIRIVASAGQDRDYVRQLRLSWADTPAGRGPSGTSIREGRIAGWSDIRIDPRYEPWRDKAAAAGFRASVSIPFRTAGKPAIGTFTLYSANPIAFGEEERRLLEELTTNLTKALQDIATRQERDAALMARSMSEQRIERLLTASATVLYALDLEPAPGHAAPTEISRNILDMLGYAPEEIHGPEWWQSHVHPDDLPQASLGIARVRDAGHYTHRYRIRHRNGNYRWIRDEMTLQRDAHGQPVGIAGVWIDITAHRTAEEEIYRLAHLDPLTGLPNRRLLNERLGVMLSEARRTGARGAVLFIDLDRFKKINDMLGHTAGDAALTEAARRLRLAIRATDTIARIGGDEFVVLLGSAGATIEDAALHATMVGRKMIDAMTGQPISIGERDYHLGASIGFTLFPKPADTIDTLIREADTAMYQAKAGNGDVVMFQPAMHQSIMVRHTIEDEIRAALKTGQFELWLQDQVDDDGMPVAAESLARLRKSDGRIASPAEFIGIAESSGLIIPLGRWLLREACSILSRIAPGRPGFGLSVNISPRQFRDPAFVGDVLAAIDDFGIPPDRLTLEITENLLINDTLAIGRIMETLAGRGIRFSVDDFGTGYSSLHYLRHLPIHEIKIDRGFVTHIPHDTSSIAIVEAILAMAHRLDLDVVAEGVETEDHVAFLRSRGRMRMQGYFFAEPMNLASWHDRHAIARRSLVSES